MVQPKIDQQLFINGLLDEIASLTHEKIYYKTLSIQLQKQLETEQTDNNEPAQDNE